MNMKNPRACDDGRKPSLFHAAHVVGATRECDLTHATPVPIWALEPKLLPSGSMAHNVPIPEPFDMRYPARRYLELIGDKWTPVVLYCLSGGTRRFGELQRCIPDISKKMLIQVLRRLEGDGLVDRRVFQQVPPKTEYTLTAAGKRIHEPIAAMCDWAMKNEDVIAVVAARRNAGKG
jgi:DNA-binding HxlR family transcriptional regulator